MEVSPSALEPTLPQYSVRTVRSVVVVVLRTADRKHCHLPVLSPETRQSHIVMLREVAVRSFQNFYHDVLSTGLWVGAEHHEDCGGPHLGGASSAHALQLGVARAAHHHAILILPPASLLLLLLLAVGMLLAVGGLLTLLAGWSALLSGWPGYACQRLPA